MKLEEATPKLRVIYIPGHAHGDRDHPDCERGAVSSCNDKYIFVKFDKQVKQLGWDETTAQSCQPADLQPISHTNFATLEHRAGWYKHPDQRGQQRRMMST
jgi:hypothetical protein